jgi:N-methylhydantoinase A
MRLRGTGTVYKPALPTLAPRDSGRPEPDGFRAVYLSDSEPEARYALHTRESLLAGDEISGPAVISEHTATTVLHAGDRLRVGRHGEMVITVGTDGKA